MSQAANSQTETEIEPLSDDALEDVSGGVCSLYNCSGGGDAVAAP